MKHPAFEMHLNSFVLRQLAIQCPQYTCIAMAYMLVKIHHVTSKTTVDAMKWKLLENKQILQKQY